MKSFKPILNSCFGFLYLCILGGCSNSTVKIPADNFTTTPVKKWTCIGPFQFDTIVQEPIKTFYNKDLEKYGIDEAIFEKSDFKKIPQTVITFEIQNS